jgi:BirA family biotin operon repressor/biotin-[acetyl-CoA-carboxylase] ligase
MTAIDLPPFFAVHRFDTIGSSNDEARRQADAGAPEGTLIWAGEQTTGRGRRGRNWTSPPGNLYLSLVLRPAVDIAVAPQLGFVCAIALGEAVAGMLPDGDTRVRYKWPNDLLVDGAKISGILLEAGPGRTGGGSRAYPIYIVAGIGVNIASAPTDLPYRAIHLVEAGAVAATPQALLKRFASRFEAGYRDWQRGGFAPVRERWLAAGHAAGDPMAVRIDENELLNGRFVDIDPSGALLLELPTGERRRVNAGDVAMMAA